MYIFLFDSMYIIHLMKLFNYYDYVITHVNIFVYKTRDCLSLSA